MSAPHPIAQAIEALREAIILPGLGATYASGTEQAANDASDEIDAIRKHIFAALAALEACTAVEGEAWLDRDCFAYDEDGNCVEPSWIFVKCKRDPPEEPPALLVLLPESEE